MTTDDTLVRETLREHLSGEPPLRTDLETVLAAGRRARAHRQVLTATAGCLGVVAAVAGGLAIAGSDAESLPLQQPPVAATPTPARAAYPGPVPALLDARVRADLPGGASLAAHEIYPSDWNRSTALPVARTADATDWHGRFTIPGRAGNEVWISVFVNPPHSNPTLAELRKQCPAGAPADPVDGAPACRVDVQRDGSLLLTQISRNSKGRWTRTLLHYRSGDRAVNAREHVKASGYAEAGRRWVYPPSRLAVLAKDPRLVIPRPVHRPPLPKPES